MSKQWPAWYFGPGEQSKIFNAAEEVPPGWFDHPSKVRAADAAAPENSKDAWEGFTKDELTQALRQAGEKIDARWSARKLFERAKELNLFVDDAAEESDGDSDSDGGEEEPETDSESAEQTE